MKGNSQCDHSAWTSILWSGVGASGRRSRGSSSPFSLMIKLSVSSLFFSKGFSSVVLLLIFAFLGGLPCECDSSSSFSSVFSFFIVGAFLFLSFLLLANGVAKVRCGVLSFFSSRSASCNFLIVGFLFFSGTSSTKLMMASLLSSRFFFFDDGNRKESSLVSA